MNRVALFIIIYLNAYISFGQIENRWQADTVYKNKNVQKIYVYENSPKDLSEIVELNKNGNIVRIEKYSASYNAKTRKSKKIELITHHVYDSSGRLTEKIDSIFYHHSNGFNINRTLYDYKDDYLIASRHYKGIFKSPYSVTSYTYEPFTSTTIIKSDTIIRYSKTKEYDKDFYVNRFYGFVLEPKRKDIQITINGETRTASHSDKTDLQRFDDDKTIKNTFNEFGQLKKSEIKSIFLNDRVNEYTLWYDYFRNGLMKSIRGYVPLYFRYAYFEK